MLRLLLVFLILRCAAATSEETEENSGNYGDDGENDEEEEMAPDMTPDMTSEMTPDKKKRMHGENAELDQSKGGEETGPDGTMIIIIAAVSVVALAIVTVVAIVLFRRYLRSQEQGVYTMPAEQGQKAAV